MRMSRIAKSALPAVAAGALLALAGSGNAASDAASTGITDTEIKIGGICPSTGPIASFVTICAMQDAYFKYVNDHDGGVMMGDGKRRKIAYTYYDDGYTPPRTVEQTRRLVERDQVALMIGPLGSATGLAVRGYLNQHGVPQLFVGSGLATFSADFEKYPWTEGWILPYTSEAADYATFVKTQKPDAKVAVLYQNDDFGKEMLAGFKKASEGSGVTVVASQSYEVSSPTVDSQMSNLAASGGDVLLVFGVPKFTAQALRAVQDSSWRPLRIIANISASKKATMDPAGPEASEGVVSGMMLMDPTSPQFAKTKDIELYREIGTKYGSAGLNLDDPITMIGFGQAQTMVATLARTKEPTRAAIMDSVRHLCGVPILGMIPGVQICSDGPKDPFLMESMQIVRYKGGTWEPVGKVITDFEGKTPRN